jgi:uncharacterized ferritin-like protein (DUF455 family)
LELRELGERVLFGARLEDKLTRPEALTDRRPGEGVCAPAMPIRPAGLELQSEGHAPFPSLNALKSEGARGALLHAFANHELLAIELMGMALLRFPDAPADYRLGLARTLCEEQDHLSLYLGRMQELGVELGDSPLSAYFWRAMSSLETPLEFVAAMNLTFEQANLDHALAFSRALEAVGDPETATILRRVHDEELGHVRHGLTWFDRWRDTSVDRWDAYRKILPAPLSPNRAKGLEFSWESRDRVGLDLRFQRELFVYSRSKGRPPIVFGFNPACESEVARGTSGGTATKLIKTLERDYAPLLLFLAGRDDAVVVPRRPSLDYLVGVRRLGIELPELLDAGDAVKELASRGVSGVRPWGWSPETLARFSPLLEGEGWPRVSAARLKQLYSKQLGAELMGAFAKEYPELAGVLGAGALGAAFCSGEEAARAHAEELLKTHPWVVLKAPFGTSGRAMLRVNGWAARSASERGWVERTLREQGGVVVEPWLDRVCDLSLQLQVGEPGGKTRPRVTRPLVDRRGQYRGHVLGRPLAQLEPDLLRAIQGDGGRAPSMLKTLESAGRFVGSRLSELGFRGLCGVDALVYRENARFCLKPIVEINPRTTMGSVALALEGVLRPGRVGVWLHIGGREFAAARDMALRASAPCMGGSPPRVEAGVLCTNDPSQAEGHLSVLAVAATPAECVTLLRPFAKVPEFQLRSVPS